MFLTTYAFFCLGCMFLVDIGCIPPSDDDLAGTCELARRNLLLHALVFISLAVFISVMRAIDIAYPSNGIYQNHAPGILFICLVLVGVSFTRIKKEELTHVTGG
jgi:hypothetical protein